MFPVHTTAWKVSPGQHHNGRCDSLTLLRPSPALQAPVLPKPLSSQVAEGLVKRNQSREFPHMPLHTLRLEGELRAHIGTPGFSMTCS